MAHSASVRHGAGRYEEPRVLKETGLMPMPRLAFAGDPRSVSPWLLHSISKLGVFESICHGEAERHIGEFHARWAFSSLDTMLEEVEPDGVVLACRLAERTREIKQCLTAGADVLVTEAPGKASACRRLALLAKLAGRFVLAVPAIRFSPAVRLARRLIESGRLSAPISMSVHSTRRGAAGDISTAGTAVSSDQVFEAVDLVDHLVGPIQRVFAASHEGGSLVAASTAGEGVPVSLVFHTSGSAETVGVEVEIRATDSTSLLVDRNGGLACGKGSRQVAGRQVALPCADPALELGYEGLLAEFGHLLEAPRSGQGLIGPAGRVTAATEAILSSAVRGRPVVPRCRQEADSKPDAARIGVVG